MNSSIITLQNSNYLFPVLIIFALVIGLAISYYFSTKNIILRTLQKSPHKSINKIRENDYAKIIGKAKYVHQPLIAPLSGRPCVYYHVKIEKKVKNSWSTYVEDKKIQDFFIESGNELAFINTTQANKFSQMYLVKDHKVQSGFLNDPSLILENYLKTLGKSSTSLLGFNKTLRYNEGVIELDEKIAIKGIAKWKSLSEPIEGYSYSKILHIYGSETQKFIITDLPEVTQKSRNT